MEHCLSCIHSPDVLINTVCYNVNSCECFFKRSLLAAFMKSSHKDMHIDHNPDAKEVGMLCKTEIKQNVRNC